MPKGMVGMPGTMASAPSTVAAYDSVLALPNTWPDISRPRYSPEPARVTTMPAAVLTSSDGICDTRPSPMVRMVNDSTAADSDM